MWIDVVDLRDFYASPVGTAAGQMIGRRLGELWPNVRGQRILGLGYAAPYLDQFRPTAERTIAAMPARQGVLKWPDSGAAATALVDERALPFPDLSMDRILVVHALECAEDIQPMMREIWRVLSDSGRVLIVVPNRSGLWARFERTPFGHGRPYSPGQVSTLLRNSLFTPQRTEKALYMPPFESGFITRSAPAWEKSGRRLMGSFAGVVVVEAVKQIYAAAPLTPAGARAALIPLPGRI